MLKALRISKSVESIDRDQTILTMTVHTDATLKAMTLPMGAQVEATALQTTVATTEMKTGSVRRHAAFAWRILQMTRRNGDCLATSMWKTQCQDVVNGITTKYADVQNAI